MHLLGLLDNWTLVVCIALSTSLSAYSFARVWKTNRSLRGSGSFALAFAVGTASCILFTLVPDSTPFLKFLNTPLGDSLVLCVYALLLSGLEQFFRVRRTTWYGWAVVAVGFTLTCYYTEGHDLIRARILVNDVCTLILRVLIGVELLRNADRKHLRTLASLMFLYALFSLVGTTETLLHAGPRDAHAWMQSRGQQSISLLSMLVFFIAVGQLLLLLLNGELVLQLREEATRDFMTGTLNRRGVERALRAEIGRSHRYGMALSVGLVDLDSFKQVNDKLGHAEGDRTLISVAQHIEGSLRAYDSVGRLGGDEFLVILPNTRTAEALFVMERLRETVARSAQHGVTLSIGVTTLAAANETMLSLLARVDAALYQAKEDGRNCARVLLKDESDPQSLVKPDLKLQT